MGRIFQFRSVVAERHIDLYGHMNNAAYMQLFEDARWGLLESVGFTRKSVKELGYGPVLVDAHLQYKRELGLGTPVLIDTELKNGDRRLFTIAQQLKLESGELCAEADFKLGIFDISLRRIIRPPEGWLAVVRNSNIP